MPAAFVRVDYQRDSSLGQEIRESKYKVAGFWSDNYVSVQQYRDRTDSEDVWEEAHITWSSGGQEGDFTKAERALNLSKALADAARRTQFLNAHKSREGLPPTYTELVERYRVYRLEQMPESHGGKVRKSLAFSFPNERAAWDMVRDLNADNSADFIMFIFEDAGEATNMEQIVSF